MGNQFLRDLRGPSRRRFLKWSGALAAAIGVDRATYLNIIADEGGHHTAEASITKALRSIHLVNGNGVYAWWQLLWPHTEVGNSNAHSTVASPTSGKVAYHEPASMGLRYNPCAAYGEGASSRGADGVNHEFHYASQAPWINAGKTAPLPGMEVTGMMAGQDETHTLFPSSAARISGKADLLAGIAALQVKESSSIAPVIGTDPFKYGSAAGAPDAVTVPNAAGLVDLFNSAASQFLLTAEKDRKIYETYYKAYVGLRRAAPRTAMVPHLEVTKKAATLVGLNYASQLQPADQLANYGIQNVFSENLVAMQRSGLDNFGRMTITCAKALALGLSNMAVIAVSPGATSDTKWTDPHSTFNTGGDLNQSIVCTRVIGDIMNGLYTYLNGIPDPENGGTMMDNTLITVHGDTAHSPLQASGWPDATPDACNWIYVVGKGYIKHGWFGRVHYQASNCRPGKQNGCTSGFDAQGNGDDIRGLSSNNTVTAAGAAIAYCVAKGNSNLVSELGPSVANYAGLLAP
jgi:hypothetical protein